MVQKIILFLSIFFIMNGYGQSNFSFRVNASDGNFILPISSACNYNYTMDGNSMNSGNGRHSGGTFNRSISVPAAGIYTVEIIPDTNLLIEGYTGLNTTQRDKIKEILNWGTAPISVENYGFYLFRFLEITATDRPVFIGSIKNLFTGCTSITNIPNIATWDMSQVTDLSNLFSYAENFNDDISNWDVSGVVSMKNMFEEAYSFNQDLNNWNTSKVQDMSYMFNKAKTFNGNISAWDTANVTNMISMFFFAENFNQDISLWNTANVENMSNMFAYASAFNQNIGQWKTSKVKSMYNILNNASSFNQNIGGWSFDSSNTISIDNSGIDCDNYGKTLLEWSTNAKDNISLSAIGLKYGTEADGYRTILLSKGWEIIGDSLDASCSGSLGIENHYQKSKISVYPNPTADYVKVKANKPIKQVQVYNTSGQLVLSETKNTEVRLANKPSGIYIVRVIMQDGTIEQEKVIKK